MPRKQFEVTEAQLNAALKAKKYDVHLALQEVGRQVRLAGHRRLRQQERRPQHLRHPGLSGEGADVKAAMPGAIADGFGVLKGPDVEALKAYVSSHSDGKSYAGYVSGWRVEITGRNADSDSDYGAQSISIRSENFYV